MANFLPYLDDLIFKNSLLFCSLVARWKRRTMKIYSIKQNLFEIYRNNRFSMGSENSRFLSQQKLPHEYKPINDLPGVYESVLTGTRIQKHLLQVNSEAEINYQKDVFIFRRMNADRIMVANYFQADDLNHFCSMSYQVNFFTQYPTYHMSQNLVLSSQQVFHLLIECLKGFEILFNKFGAFNITGDHIFFNSHHQPRVWISSNLGKTRIQSDMGNLETEEKMIIDLFKLFDSIKDQRNLSISFSNYLVRILEENQRHLTFKNVIMYMVDQASKFFVNRTKKIHKNNTFLQTNITAGSTKPSYNKFSNSIGFLSPKFKQNLNPISLKTKTSMRTDNNSSNGGFEMINNAVQTESPESNYRNFIQRIKKSKRHNSQEDLSNREIFDYKQNFRGNFEETLKNSPTIHHNQRIKPPIQNYKAKKQEVIKVIRRSINEQQKFVHIVQYQKQLDTTKRNSLNKPKQLPSNCQQTKTVQFQQIQKSVERQVIKTVNFENSYQVPRKKPYTQFFHKTETQYSYLPNYNTTSAISHPKIEDSNTILTNLQTLQTLKSIANSQYSDMDSQIRKDLENLKL